jgi:hypothetical protein
VLNAHTQCGGAISCAWHWQWQSSCVNGMYKLAYVRIKIMRNIAYFK